MNVFELAPLPNTVLYRQDGQPRVRITGSWFPKRDDVQGVVRLRQHFLDAFGEELRDAENVYLDIYVKHSDIDLDRAVTGCCTALDGQHGNVRAALWDDACIRQIKVTRISQQSTGAPQANQSSTGNMRQQQSSAETPAECAPEAGPGPAKNELKHS